MRSCSHGLQLPLYSSRITCDIVTVKNAGAKHVNSGRNTAFVILLNTADEIFGWGGLDRFHHFCLR